VLTRHYEVLVCDTSTRSSDLSRVYATIVSYESMNFVKRDLRRTAQQFIRAKGILEGSGIRIHSNSNAFEITDRRSVLKSLYNLAFSHVDERKVRAHRNYFMGWCVDSKNWSGGLEYHLVIEARTKPAPAPYLWCLHPPGSSS
jgi:hypothetical protein